MMTELCSRYVNVRKWRMIGCIEEDEVLGQNPNATSEILHIVEQK
jgi:hypothetical protein